MSTSKSLQQPKIVEIIGSTIRVAHPDISGNVRTSLAAQIAASGTTMTVLDNNGFADNDWFIVGKPGQNQTEECDVNGAVTRGQSMTVTNTLKFTHEIDAPVTKILERGIKIYGASTDGGSGTLIASVDAVTTPIADAVMIQWDKLYTEYTLISTDTAYDYYFVKFTDGTTDSSASDYVASTGITYLTVEDMMQRALSITGQRLGERITRDTMVQWVSDCQDEILQFKYQDPRSGNYLQKDWSFEVELDETSITVSEGENAYALSSLTTGLKYPNSDKSIINVRFGTSKPLAKVAIDDFDKLFTGVGKTALTVEATAAATSITVSSTADFADTGSLLVGGDTLTYTAKTSTTFTGIPASGTGAITETHSVGASVWQNISGAVPRRYVIWENYIYLDKPVEEDYDGQALRIRYFKALTRLTSESDVVVIPFTNAFTQYLVGMIHYRNDKQKLGDAWMGKFRETVLNNALADKIPSTDEMQYRNFIDPVYGETSYDDSGAYDYYEFH